MSSVCLCRECDCTKVESVDMDVNLPYGTKFKFQRKGNGPKILKMAFKRSREAREFFASIFEQNLLISRWEYPLIIFKEDPRSMINFYLKIWGVLWPNNVVKGQIFKNYFGVLDDP